MLQAGIDALLAGEPLGFVRNETPNLSDSYFAVERKKIEKTAWIYRHSPEYAAPEVFPR